MAEPVPGPGYDEIAVAAPPGRYLCHSRQHAELGCLAEVIVTLGQVGTRWRRDALWQDCWGRSYAMCAECWMVTRQVAGNHRPGLVVIEAAAPPATFLAAASRPRGPGQRCPAAPGDRAARAPGAVTH